MDSEPSGSYMERIKLTALRDFAIEHFPRAQLTRSQSHANDDDYHRALFGVAVLALSSPTPSAVQQTAAQLLKIATSLLVAWSDYCSLTPKIQQENDEQALSTALQLSTLTGISLPFLSTQTATEEPLSTNEPAPSRNREQAADQPPLKPGLMLTTQEAADYLRMKTQTLHKWASSGSGPVTPVKMGRKLGWPSTEILRIMGGKA